MLQISTIDNLVSNSLAGSGKSTRLSALRDDRIELTSFNYIPKNNNGDIVGHS